MTNKQITQLTAIDAVASGDEVPISDVSASNATKKGTFAQILTYIKTAILSANPLAVYAAGTVYQLTATPAAVTFGTTSPALTLDKAGTYRLRYRLLLKYNGATFAASKVVTSKLRRTNNTAADLTDSSAAVDTGVVTTLTQTFIEITREVFYTTATTDDIIALYGSVAEVPSVGSLDVVDAEITAQRLQY